MTSARTQCEWGCCAGLAHRRVRKRRRARLTLRVGHWRWKVCETCADLMLRDLRAEGYDIVREHKPAETTARRPAGTLQPESAARTRGGQKQRSRRRKAGRRLGTSVRIARRSLRKARAKLERRRTQKRGPEFDELALRARDRLQAERHVAKSSPSEVQRSSRG